jgi:hypothetical protein
MAQADGPQASQRVSRERVAEGIGARTPREQALPPGAPGGRAVAGQGRRVGPSSRALRGLARPTSAYEQNAHRRGREYREGKGGEPKIAPPAARPLRLPCEALQLLPHLGSGERPLAPVGLEQPGEKAREGRRDRYVRLEIESEALLAELGGLRPREREHERRAERVEVRARNRLALELLDRHVAAGPHDRGPARVQHLVRQVIAHGAEVDEIGALACGEKHVGRFHVPMQDRRLEAVQVLEDTRELDAERERLGFVEAAARADELVEAAALDVLLDQANAHVLAVFFAEEIDEPRDARVVEPLQHARLARQQFVGLQGIGRRQREHLHHAALARLVVEREVGRGGDTPAENGLKLVPA